MPVSAVSNLVHDGQANIRRLACRHLIGAVPKADRAIGRPQSCASHPANEATGAKVMKHRAVGPEHVDDIGDFAPAAERVRPEPDQDLRFTHRASQQTFRRVVLMFLPISSAPGLGVNEKVRGSISMVGTVPACRTVNFRGNRLTLENDRKPGRRLDNQAGRATYNGSRGMIGRTQPMPDDDRFRRFVVRDEERPGKLELLLDGIEFMREELGEPPGSLPVSLELAELEHAELKSRVEPPTERQLANMSWLVQKTGGVMTGEVCSRRQAELLIEELLRLLTEQHETVNVRAHCVHRERRSATDWDGSGEWGEGLGPVVVGAGIIVPYSVCLFLWFEATITWTVLAMAVLFVVGGGFYVLGLWR